METLIISAATMPEFFLVGLKVLLPLGIVLFVILVLADMLRKS